VREENKSPNCGKKKRNYILGCLIVVLILPYAVVRAERQLALQKKVKAKRRECSWQKKVWIL